jgi:3-oxoacyl-[acyl-carrier-protein] synthase-3
MTSFNMQILGTGRFLPSKIMTNYDFAKNLDTNHEWIVERTGIVERRICDPAKDEFPSTMAMHAAKEAIAMAKIDPNEIELILFSVTIPDMFFPNTASVLQEKLGITNMCACLDISAACSGYVYGMAIANSFIQTGMYKKILLIGCEMTSRFNNWEDRSTCILFGDGCGATIIGRDEKNTGSKLLSAKLGSDSSKKEALILRAGAAGKPITHEVLDNKENFISMDGQQVFKAAVKTLASQCEEVISKAGLTNEQIDWFVPHQANLRIIEAVAHRFNFPKEKCIINVDRYANTSSATIPIALDEALRDGKIKRGQYILMATFGAGLTSGACVLKF